MNFQELQERLQTISKTSQFKLALALGALLLGIGSLVFWAAKPEYAPIYAQLSEKDAGEVLDSLNQNGFKPKIQSNGQITIPAESIYKARYFLATQGLPKSSDGALPLTAPGFGSSSAQEAAYRQSILEKEIARSIQSIQGVQSARVHIAQPKTTIFGKEQTGASASIVVDAPQISKTQAKAIRHLVVTAVPGLTAANTTIVSSEGHSFEQEDANATVQNSTPEQLKIIAQLRKDYQERVLALISPITGKNGARAEVELDVVFEDEQRQTETWKPNVGTSAIRSQRLDESSLSNSSSNGGVPGAASNMPPLALPPLPSGIDPASNLQEKPAATNTSGNIKKESITNYELDRSVTQSNKNGLVIKKVKAAVLLNYKNVTDPKTGTSTATAFSNEEVAQISDLVKETIGFDEQRGDSVKVASFPFDPAETKTPESPPIWQDPYFWEQLIPALRWGVVFVFALFAALMIRKTLRSIFPPPPEPVVPPKEIAQEALTNEEKEASYTPSHQKEPLISAEQAKAMANANPAAVATVLKEWIKTGEAQGESNGR